MKLTIWAELPTAKDSIVTEVPDEEITTPTGTVDMKKAEEVAKAYLGNIMQWGWSVKP